MVNGDFRLSSISKWENVFFFYIWNEKKTFWLLIHRSTYYESEHGEKIEFSVIMYAPLGKKSNVIAVKHEDGDRKSSRTIIDSEEQ